MFIGSSAITGVTGTFVGGCLAYYNGEYLLLDSTAASPRLIRVKPTLAMGATRTDVPTLAVSVPRPGVANEDIELPVGAGPYFGVATSGGAVVLLRQKRMMCGGGRIAVAELVTVDVLSGAVSDIQEVYSYEDITLLGGLCSVGSELRFLGEFGGTRSFYGIYTNGDIRKITGFTPSITGQSALAYDEPSERVLVLNGSNEVLAFQSEWLMSEMTADITLDTANTEGVGIAQVGDDVAVLNANPLRIYWYGDRSDDLPPVGTSDVRLTNRRQYSILGFLAETFAIGATEFQGIRGQRVRRVQVEGEVPAYEDVTEVRITPEFPLQGVKVGMHIMQGDKRYVVRGIAELGNAYRQSFLVR